MVERRDGGIKGASGVATRCAPRTLDTTATALRVGKDEGDGGGAGEALKHLAVLERLATHDARNRHHRSAL